jgi:hypothetical protein
MSAWARRGPVPTLAAAPLRRTAALFAFKVQVYPLLNPALERLGILAGEWNVEMSSMSFHPDPSAVIRWRISFEWLEGGIFLVQREEVISPDVPHGTWIIGPDDAAGAYCVLHLRTWPCMQSSFHKQPFVNSMGVDISLPMIYQKLPPI